MRSLHPRHAVLFVGLALLLGGCAHYVVQAEAVDGRPKIAVSADPWPEYVVAEAGGTVKLTVTRNGEVLVERVFPLDAATAWRRDGWKLGRLTEKADIDEARAAVGWPPLP